MITVTDPHELSGSVSIVDPLAGNFCLTIADDQGNSDVVTTTVAQVVISV